ncbi:MAG TPA: glycosyltransferase family 4 protein [Blastocatellia bacterium]|nr:glycosyltransferase family 4 protein [Blastocatellia bacterium]
MRILIVHNRYLIRAGEDMSWTRAQSLLRQHGHEIVNYTRDNREITQISSWKTGVRTVWSIEDYSALRKTIRQHRPDVMTINNFFPLISPAAYYAARAEGVPVVQYLHNYRLLCLGSYLFRKGQVCEECLGKSIPWPGILHGCYRQNRIVSSAVAAMLTTHQALKTWRRMVDVYVALTDFCRDKFIEGGLPAEKIVVKPNFVHPDPGVGTGAGGYAFYAGRLTVEKGVDTLITAWEKLGRSIPLKIIGEGELVDQVLQAARNNPAIEYLGPQNHETVIEMMKQASFLAFPSRWYEGMPGTIIEAYGTGTPVITSALGSMSGMVEHGKTGLHFRAGDVADLIRQVTWATSHPAAMASMRLAARTEFETRYTADKNYEALIRIYQLAVDRGLEKSRKNRP